MTKNKDLVNTVYAGLFAAGGSFFGKLTGYCGILLSININIEILLKIICIGLMLFCNVLNWRYFVKALQSTDQTLSATVLSSASNYCFSFIFGFLIFGEKISLLSILGIFFILFGLVFLCKDDVSDVNKKKSAKKNK